MADIDDIDRTASEISHSQEIIIQRFVKQLEGLETESAGRKGSTGKRIPILTVRLILRRGTKTRTDVGDTWAALKRGREIIAAFNSETLSTSNTQISETVKEVRDRLGSLETSKEKHKKRGVFRIRSSKTETRLWSHQLQNAMDSAGLLQDTLKMSQCADSVSHQARNTKWVENQAVPPHRHQSFHSLTTETSNATNLLTKDRSQPEAGSDIHTIRAGVNL
jgi:hypothetical protein